MTQRGKLAAELPCTDPRKPTVLCLGFYSHAQFRVQYLLGLLISLLSRIPLHYLVLLHCCPSDEVGVKCFFLLVQHAVHLQHNESDTHLLIPKTK